jgi:hypothetical protein
MNDKFVFQKFDQNLVCLATSQFCDSSDDLSWNPFVIPHAQFDGSHDTQLLLRNKV